jgi:small subunit ribosomal protein S9
MSSRKKSVLVAGKRKSSKARVLIQEGKGRVRINNTPIHIYQPIIARMKIMEAISLSGDYGPKVDINVKVHGGGTMGQAEAARIGIARGLVKYTRSKRLRKAYVDYDRTMLAGDERRKESKKFGGPGARRRKQKSYR